MRRVFQQPENKDLDISPLIDVVFILLIFFMVSTTFIKDAQLELDRPSAKSATTASNEAVRVSIDKHGDIYLADSPVRLWMLQSRVREGLRASGDSSVLIVADRGTTTDKLIDVVDQCRMGGASEVGVITDKEHGSLTGN